MSDNEAKAEELLQGQTEQSRHETDPTDADADRPDLPEAVADAYDAIDEGDVSSNLTLRDENLAALFHGLEASGRLEGLGTEAAHVLERDDAETDSRAAVLRLLVRIGLSDVDDSVLEAGKAGRQRYLDTDDF